MDRGLAGQESAESGPEWRRIRMGGGGVRNHPGECPGSNILHSVQYMHDIDEILETISVFTKFADDTKLGQEMRTQEDKEKLQRVLDGLVEWASTWGMKFNVAKC